jgi:cellulose synthase/poly-beta-1,6-N-acetylglucosamine synthase-like glycosyltransferase
VFGYITVLPGAFSAYRYIALQNDSTGQGPLQKYFLGESKVIFPFLPVGLIIDYALFDVAWRRR